RFAEEFRISDFMQMFKEMSERKDRHFGYTYEKLESFLIKLHSLGLLHQYNLYRDDRIVSSNLLLQNSNDIAYTVFRATDPEALRNGASSLHTVKLCENMAGKASELDFCGANIPEIARFKAALGLTLKVFYQIRT
ncbi:MAG: GNAT family N-acetyltransferase, partial [Candidatus Cloacimonetes bacterium]|nr:GNAT family N-acetyltransferase [Candidatus Cloacimonadota bacterium]